MIKIGINTTMVTLSDEYSDSQATKTAETGDGGGIEEKHTPWSKGPPTEPAPPLPAVDGVVSITIPDEILADPNPLWRCYVVGYFIGDASHIGTIHATVIPFGLL